MNYSIFYRSFPNIKIEDNLFLRKISPEVDYEPYYKYMSSAKMRQFLSDDHIPTNLESALDDLIYWQKLFSTKRSLYWAIADKNNYMIGTAGFNHISFKNGRAEISYDLDPNYWGMGYMSKSLNAILDFAENELELIRVQATVDIDNDRSIKLLERCGLLQEGILKKYEVVAGQHKDYFMYSKIFNNTL
jgi:ribosomal-protein-alanine N-acetyltransferase